MTKAAFKAIRLKYLTHIEMGQSPPSSDYTNEGEGLPFLQGTAEFGEVFPSPKVYCENPPKKAKEGDILFSVRAPVGELNKSNQEYGIGRGLCAITAKENSSKDYIWWALHHAREQLRLVETGTTYAAVSAEDVANTLVTYIPLDNQKRIGNYLGKETQRIDTLIQAKDNLLGLLAEKKQALITRAVTKGINRKARMKDSGIDWIGEIPEHWEVVQLKYLAKEPLKYGANEAALDDNPDNPRFIRITDIDEEGKLKDETFKSLEKEIAEPYMLEDGDILLARSGATVGKTIMYEQAWGDACFAGYLIRLRPDKQKLLSRFMILVAQSEYYWSQIKQESIQATISNFSGEKYASMLVLLPDIDEQQKIVSYINSELPKINHLMDTTENSIDLLKERRAALIAAAVTGEIDVN